MSVYNEMCMEGEVIDSRFFIGKVGEARVWHYVTENGSEMVVAGE